MSAGIGAYPQSLRSNQGLSMFKGTKEGLDVRVHDRVWREEREGKKNINLFLLKHLTILK